MRKKSFQTLSRLDLRLQILMNQPVVKVTSKQSELPLHLDDQTQMDSKPASQPEQASLNQCQLIAANSPKLLLWACPADYGDQDSL